MFQKDNAPKGSGEQQNPIPLAIDTSTRHSDRAVETRCYTADVQDLSYTYLDASTLSRSDLMPLFFAFFLLI